MEGLYPRCAGLDVHKDTVAASVRIQEAGRARHPRRELRHDNEGTTSTGRLARRTRGDARRNGGHRHLLEAGLACA